MYHHRNPNAFPLTLAKAVAELSLKSPALLLDSAVETLQAPIDPTLIPLISRKGG